MRKWIKAGLLVAVLLVFSYSAWHIAVARSGYKKSREVYETAAEDYTRPAVSAPEAQNTSAPRAEEPAAEPTAENAPEERTEEEYAPIEVDFAELTKVNPDVYAWIYCEDTVINYPVLWGRDNEYYLERNYRGGHDPSGSIFSDAGNFKGVIDYNIILYGHHMQDMSMFATLKYWLEQEYYEEHPVMWLLTPEQDYRIELFSGYVTSADSETYTIFREGGEELGDYLQRVREKSDFSSSVEMDPEERYVVLSTCAYSFQLARTVLHGRLVPVDSAGGIPLNHEG